MDGTEVLHEEIQNDNGRRSIEIPFSEGQSEIEITGTWMVPEFLIGPVGIMVASMIVIVTLSGKLKVILPTL